MRMIDADALEKFLKRLRRELPKESRDFFTRDEMILNFQQYVHMQPTIDAVPVACGTWEVAIGYDPNKKVQCQNCYRMAYEPTAYCPNCGAKMVNEEN